MEKSPGFEMLATNKNFFKDLKDLWTFKKAHTKNFLNLFMVTVMQV